MIMMNSIQMSEVLKTLNNWEFVDSFSVGVFSHDGNYFALADDGGVAIIRRKLQGK